MSPYVLEAEDPAQRFEQFVRLGGILFVVGGILATMVTLLPGSSTYANPHGIGVVGLLALVTGLTMLSAPGLFMPPMFVTLLVGAIILITFGVHFAGPAAMGYAAMLYSWITSLGFAGLRRRWFIPLVGLIAIAFAVVQAVDVREVVGINNWVFTIGTIIITGFIVSLLVEHFHRLAIAEADARKSAETAREELFLLNRDLEDRVAAKVLEIERLSELRRLVSANVANALLESQDALAPHRREIAAFFIDLRGFTGFAMDADPGDVIQVLEQFYQVLGRSFAKYDATVGAFEADGVMAYLNDPVPIENPAQQAVEMALDLREPMQQLVSRWEACGYALHYGIGIAMGFATMGMVGFEGRQDYTAIGTAVNLASRLCDEARAGAILIDRRTWLATVDVVETEPLEELDLKGFREPVPAFRVTRAIGAVDRHVPQT